MCKKENLLYILRLLSVGSTSNRLGDVQFLPINDPPHLVNFLFKCKVCTEITRLKQILSTSNPTIFIKIVSISSQAHISQSDNYNSSQLLQYLTKASQWHPSSRSNSRCRTFESQPRNSSKNFFLHETLLNTTMRRMSPPKKSGAKETKSEIDEEDIFDDKLQ
jgi:hypothetical protein